MTINNDDVATSYLRKYRQPILIGVVVLCSLVVGGIVGAKLNGSSMRQPLNAIAVSNPVYRWIKLKQIIADETTHSSVAPIKCPTDYKAIAIFGQSNSANQIERSQGLKNISDGNTFMWDWTTGLCYPYSEPVVGTDGGNRGNIITSAITGFRNIDKETNLIIAAFGRGGSSVFSWSHSVQSIRLDEVIKQMHAAKIQPSLFLWHQGESDAIDEIYFQEKLKAYGAEIGMKKMFYEKALDIVFQKVHSAFPNAHIGLALASICKNEGSQEVRAAQKAIQNKYPWVSISSDTDVYGTDFRSDGCHFNEKAEQHIANDYKNLLVKTLMAKK